MSVYRSSILCIEIYKTIKNLNPELINNIFKVKENKALLTEQYKVNLETSECIFKKFESIWKKYLEQRSFSYQTI